MKCLLLPLLICLSMFTKNSNEKRIFSNGFLGGPTKSLQIKQGPESLPKWFDQILDHTSRSNQTMWKQRYYVNDKYYSPGAPIFVMIGGEGEATARWMSSGAWIHYASEVNALCLQLEHRYYGESRPTSDMSLENLQYLSSEQALMDMVNFINHMKALYKIQESQKWIVFGGSYPGSLAAWAREKYPETIHGAISSSGPLLAKIDFTEYFDVVKDSLESYSADCVKAVNRSVQQLEILLRHRIGQNEINTKFELCDPIENSIHNQQDMYNFFESIAGNFAGVVQYNKDNSPHATVTIDEVCDIMTNTSIGTPVQRLGAVNHLLLTVNKEPCLDYKYSKMIDDLKNTTWDREKSMRQWTYQTCTEFGFFQTSEDRGSLFGNHFSADFFVKQCMDIYSTRIDQKFLEAAVSQTNKYYGALKPNTTNVLYIHGSIDPWHALGLTSSNNPNTPTIYIQGTAHCANMYEPTDNDPPALVKARQQIRAFILSIL